MGTKGMEIISHRVGERRGAMRRSYLWVGVLLLALGGALLMLVSRARTNIDLEQVEPIP